ncbi:MAG: succinate dehydrogenase/fumarate reductase cytochrome b subunit [Desulfovibrio sp.]|jgi:fumarate reductase subunit C|nr:succinate dehydrogenase/fumarate reductase cytochrome b subunit [Desulfovibrio sp.]
MTVETSILAGRPSKWDGILDVCQMLSGIGLILFMWAHMILVASVLFGPGVMNAIAEFFESTGMAQVGGPLIFLLFLFHFLLAARKLPFRFEGMKIIFSHAKMMRHRDTWLWVVQAVSAMIILIMGSIHMWVVLTDLPITAAKSAARIQGGFWTGFYLLLLPMVELHVGVGLYRIGVKWGLVKTDGRAGLHRGERILTLIFICIGLATLIRFWFINTLA